MEVEGTDNLHFLLDTSNRDWRMLLSTFEMI